MEISDIQKAKKLLTDGSYTCVLMRGNEIYTSKLRGVRPLIDLLDRHGRLQGFSAADKTVGAGAAQLYILLGVHAVWAHVMSEKAKLILENHGITAECETLVPFIINRTGDGVCPIESAVSDTVSPDEALLKIREVLKRLSSGVKHTPLPVTEETSDYSENISRFNLSVKRTIADMHTHSLSSHDSQCELEDMCRSQLKNNVSIFAVTDHCDIFLHERYDIYTPIVTSFNKAQQLNEKYKGKCRILTGIELGEGFWFPEQCKKAVNLLPYDVIIGSVHSVRYGDMTEPYSRIDFSKLSEKECTAYLDAYFNDMLTMLETTDFDILAHLTCPIRYITGRYGKRIDISVFDGKITEIFSQIIKRGIALEINTSSYKILGEPMPERKLIEKYLSMGGELITLGSDAHAPEHAAADFGKAISLLRELGISNVFAFEKRHPVALKIQ